MNILEKIVEFKRGEVRNRKSHLSVSRLEQSPLFNREKASFFNALNSQGPSVIGEFKRKSPSKGIINTHSEPAEVALGYENAGISAMSVLTDREFFGGDDSDLVAVAEVAKIPLLRKEFIVDEYQIIEARSIGASAILLIASVLDKKEILNFSKLASSLHLDVLFEIHEISELEKHNEHIKIIGVNNRNLNTFDVNLENSIELLSYLPADCIKVAESGFRSAKEVSLLYSAGYKSFLIGERFMKSEDPGKSAKKFINELTDILNGS